MITDRLGDPAVVYQNFGSETLQRALGYLDVVDDVRVGVHTRSRITAQARVQGTVARPYLVDLEAYTEGRHTGEVLIETWCSCPVTQQCKHGAALAFRLGRVVATPDRPAAAGGAGRSGGPAPHGWRDQLDGVLAGLAPLAAPETEHPALALRVTLDTHDGRRRGPTLRLRPMRRGARGWVKAGIDWYELPVLAVRRSHDPVQLEALNMLRRGFGYGHGHDGSVSMAEFGPQVVRLLREAVAAGVVLYAAPPLHDVRLLAEPAAASVDVVSVGEGVDVRLAVLLDGRPRPASELLLLGTPAHTVAAVDEGVVTLASLATPLGSGPLDLLTRRPSVLVPAGETDDLPDYLRRLRRFVAVGSSDGSASVPEVLEPRLRVTVTWRTAVGADVAWSWVYRLGDTERSCPLEGGDDLADLDGLRDRGAERRVRTGLEQRGPLDTAARTVRGADTVGLALLELPAWRERGDLDVVERDRPDFRAAMEEPAISFDLVEADPGPDLESGRTDWLDLEVVIDVDGERVALSDVVESLTRGQEFLVLPSGLYVPTDLPAFAALAEAVRAAAELRERRGDDRLRVGRDDLGVLADLGDLGPVSSGAAAWVDRARALRDLVDLPSPEPTGVATELRGYQRDGFRWLAFLWQHGLGGILADDMGLGKTLQVLALVAHTRADTRARGARAPFLVVAPTSVVSAWAEQAAQHTPDLKVRTVEATRRRRVGSIAALAADADVVVTSYTLLRLEADDYATVEWDGVVLDEAQQVKNHRSQAHQAIRRLRTPFALAVTGTPFENRLLELWSLLTIVSPGLYPTQRAFTEHVVRPVERQQDQDALRRFTRRIKPFVLRRTKELVAADLPPKQEQVLDVELNPRHRKLYDSHLARERQRILGLLEDFDENRVAILAALTRLRQLALDPGLVDPDHDVVGSAKLDVLLDHLAEVAAEGHRALVFSTFTGFLGRARARLAASGIDHAYLDGSTTARAEVIERFRSGTAPVFLISLRAGGVGLTLTEADYVFVLDPWWNPAAEAQAVDRAHRIGQQSTVMVYRLVSRDTIEDKVMALKERKAALFASVLDGETRLADGISAADVRSLFD